jgi:hypothetical protein
VRHTPSRSVMTALPRFATFNRARRMSVEGSSRDARFPEPLRQSVDVGLVAEREPRDVLGKRVFGVDLHQLAPYAAGFPGLAQMAGRDGGSGRARDRFSD